MNDQTRILCVDDERNVLRALERIFLDDDYEILTAASGEEGLQLLSESPQVKVVISDFRMPGMNGVEFLKEVFTRHPETIRIVLSGYADTAAVVAAINEGKIYKFIPKPWNDDELRVTVAKALEHFEIQRRNEQLAEELRRKNQELCELNADLQQRAVSCSCGFMQKHGSLLHAAVALDHLPLGVLTLDGGGTVLQMNREAAHLLQVGCHELVGKRLAQALPPQFAQLAEQARLPGPGCRSVQAGGTQLKLEVRSLDQDAGELLITIAPGA
ncbi:response regulator [Geomonas sp. Red69]|uniref:Response regulator n=1 Tax=Geomonas diazotrophica TaxID=2843197 RepID=A0ABX8JH41_9BACT|nr:MULTISPECIES: response regulator [Geomonas]MBU5635245.1 response regulator [Geomonas diazotrophica]QWV97700.1 response regulator [Geomonas nitrogeniifigens]QXE86836.1 response regulator [Geomonas nitrogeniifigens]